MTASTAQRELPDACRLQAEEGGARSEPASCKTRLRAAVRRQQAWRRPWLHLRRVCLIASAKSRRIGPHVKRLVDMMIALLLSVLLAPVAAAMAIVSRLATGSFFQRLRVIGRKGREFSLLSFSATPSMRRRSWGRLAAGLPLIWHVLKGDLAWVGPRPLPLESARKAGFQRRMADRPGVICLWSVRRQANIDYDSEWEVDCEYAETFSMMTDLGIALRSLWLGLIGQSPRRSPASEKLNVLGIPIRNVSMDDAVNEVVACLESDGPTRQATFVNADCANLAQRQADYMACLREVDWNYADGIGMKMAAQLQRSAIRQNVNGTDFFPRLLTRMEESRLGVFLLGGEPGIADCVAEWIQERHPGVVVCGAHHGFFAEQETNSVLTEISESGADLLLVAMGAPRQELWLRRFLCQTNVRLGIGVGGLFDFYSGKRKRAPQWVRELGMEWAFRWLLEPRRLFRRYFIGNFVFLARVLRDRMRVSKRAEQSNSGDCC